MKRKGKQFMTVSMVHVRLLACSDIVFAVYLQRIYAKSHRRYLNNAALHFCYSSLEHLVSVHFMTQLKYQSYRY
jgi:hypothetical protein